MKRIDENTVKLAFERDGEDWFAVINEWEGSRADLQMVAGADVMCDIFDKNGEGTGLFATKLSIVPPIDYRVKLVKVEETPLIGGALYMSHWSGSFKEIEPFAIWLCGVTEYVFGHLPEEIYIV